MQGCQITVRLPPDLKSKFDAYAAGFGLKASELAKLLIARERRRRRLVETSETRAIALELLRAGRGMPTVTAHLSSIEEVQEFDAYAQSCGLNRSQAGAWILATELQERWLER